MANGAGPRPASRPSPTHTRFLQEDRHGSEQHISRRRPSAEAPTGPPPIVHRWRCCCGGATYSGPIVPLGAVTLARPAAMWFDPRTIMVAPRQPLGAPLNSHPLSPVSLTSTERAPHVQ